MNHHAIFGIELNMQIKVIYIVQQEHNSICHPLYVTQC